MTTGRLAARLGETTAAPCSTHQIESFAPQACGRRSFGQPTRDPLPAIIYIHGFNSSPASFKARLIRERLEQLGCAGAFRAPALPDRPAGAIATLEEEVAAAGPEATLVGSSLGGYYATWLAERHGLRAVLVNPAVEAPRLLEGLLGPQTNLYTGEAYELTPQHLAELRSFETGNITRPERYLLLVTTGDEVLDYRKAMAKYRGCRQIVVPGSDHGFGEFGDYVDDVLAFAGFVPAEADRL
ncbi:MAG TPA: YqiA/YcfP family alpha/beta fold hydrolase [Pelomicrobium sp.]|nr:YqiA/YcfP family alpha/beta fold hydrolase [Pelomicrobium sp.]